jgi:hypothetical protein
MMLQRLEYAKISFSKVHALMETHATCPTTSLQSERQLVCISPRGIAQIRTAVIHMFVCHRQHWFVALSGSMGTVKREPPAQSVTYTNARITAIQEHVPRRDASSLIASRLVLFVRMPMPERLPRTPVIFPATRKTRLIVMTSIQMPLMKSSSAMMTKTKTLRCRTNRITFTSPEQEPH